jgi:hypothetical protein
MFGTRFLLSNHVGRIESESLVYAVSKSINVAIGDVPKGGGEGRTNISATIFITHRILVT